MADHEEEDEAAAQLALWKAEKNAQMKQDARVSLPFGIRLPLATTISFLAGMALGISHGSQTAGLRFRAENAHRLPTTPTGWYLYHKSKNYNMALGGVKEGIKMGAKVSIWTSIFFGIEDMFDRYRGTKDFLNTLVASLSVAGGFSLWNRFPLTTAARTAKSGLAIGLAYGLAQDALGAARGRRPGYSSPRQSSYSSSHASANQFVLSDTDSHSSKPPPPNSTMTTPTALSILPLSAIIRSLAVTTISSSPILLPPSLAVMSLLANSKSSILSPDSNPLLRFFLKKTFYRQFCAGENAAEVQRTINYLKDLGFKGVILGYAREVVMDENEQDGLKVHNDSESSIQNEIIPWANGTMETVKLANPEDFVALKFTGAGRQALYELSKGTGPSPALKKAIDEICDLAAARNVRLLFDAEQAAVQGGIDLWTLNYMRKYNSKTPGKALVYGTYQAYLKSTPATLASHLAAARKDGFTLGIKLVRGAYLGSDPRDLIHDTKTDTDTAYNGIAESLIKRSYGDILRPAEGEEPGKPFPSVNVVLAGHNQQSVQKALAVRTSQVQKGEELTDLVYAQLQGMADEISCELVRLGKNFEGVEKRTVKVDVPQAYKYLVWGTTGECMKYLLRRAEENRDAVTRTKAGRDAMAKELARRVKSVFGLRA
ncbi:hypothetical protein B7463_g3613, partial [Scytalidium lignicola]